MIAKDFMIGAATAAHQVEGNNIHSDYWLQENMPHTSFLEPSGIACDHYNRYKEDIKMMADAGLNAYRFSIEWARIEPEEGLFDENEINHYEDVINTCLSYNVKPIVTLMHFTSPAWLIKKAGWTSVSTVEYFRRYVSYVIDKLGSKLEFVCTINEANMGLQLAAISKRFKLMAEQAAKKADGTVQVGMNFEKMMENMKYAAMENAQIFGTPDPKIFVSSRDLNDDEIVIKAHLAAREEIKKLYPNIKVGLTLSLHDLQDVGGGEKYIKEAWNEEFSHYLPYIKDDDFLGVQNYTRTLYGENGQLPAPEGAELTQMNYEYYPEALGNVIRKVNEEYKGVIIVTENGVAIDDDERRVNFINKAIEGIKKCLNEGIKINGYFYWSLMDNFEWQKGYSQKFGLVAVDRTSMERTAKKSLYYLGSYNK